ncbi:outer membrane lipoprotein-sorting protein [Marinobacter sp. SS5-14b]|uniref:outer membrane lipoprotein-sorting protein n=1 Tax=Marinobacter sp. SS5-14b TaxID=3050456 RepID=UPI0026DFCA52|nr:outer membrane lipoprotein-sorting protein [Marinobacter sp. SS5-14b]
MKENIVLIGVRRPWMVLILGLLLMAGLASGLTKIYKDSRADAFLEEDNPALLYKNKVQEIFGLSDPLVIAIEDLSTEGVFRLETLKLVANLTDQVNELDSVNAARTISLATESNIVGVPDGLEVTPFLELLEDGGSPGAVRKAVGDFPLYHGMLVSDDDAMTVIVAELYDDELAEEAYQSIVALTDAIELDPVVSIHVAGEGAVLGFLGHYIDRDASRLNPMAGLIITIMLIIAFRRLLPALLGNAVIAASVLMTVGFMAYSGVPFFVITNAMPVILIGIAVADTIHILSHYYECQAKNPDRSLQDCIEEAVLVMFRPVTLTTLTTIAGFLGLYASSYMPPFEYFGLFTAFGVLVAWLYSIFVLPALIRLFKPTVSQRWVELERNSRRDVFSRGVNVLGRLATRRPTVTIAVFSALALVGIALTTQLQVNENRINTFHADEPLYQADKRINEHLDGTNTLDIVITTPKVEGLFDVEVLRRVEALQAYAETLPHVNGSVSVVDYLKQMNKSLNEGRQDFYALPESDALVAQYFLLYAASGDPSDFEEVIDYDYRLANIRLHLDTAEFVATRPVIEALQSYIDTQFDSDKAGATLSGRVNVNYHWIKDLGQSHFLGVIVALVFVCLVSALLFRSLSAGLMAAVPVVCSILVVYSAMVLLGINLGIGTSMFASVAIGLGIDFSIHTLERIKTLVEEGVADMTTLLAELYTSTGRALLFNYLAIAFGFGVLISSKVVPLTHFGTVVVLSVTMSFLAAITLLPALVMVVRPAFIFGKAATQSETQQRPASVLGSVNGLLPILMLAAIGAAGLIGTAPAEANDQLSDGSEVAQRINAVDEGQHATSEMAMILTDSSGKERKRHVTSYRKYFGQEKKTVLFFKEPANVRGTAFLTYDYPDADKDDDQWLYLPALRKVRRISASNRGDYFLGTDFTYEDIKLSGRVDRDDYTFTVDGQGTLEVDGKVIDVLHVEAIPKTKEIADELGYGKTRLWVNTDNWVVVKNEFWDPKGNRLKTYRASDIRQVDGIWTRHQLDIENHLTGHRSRFLFSDVDYQTAVRDRLFTSRALVKGL